MTIKENYEQYCNRAKEHLKIVTKGNIPKGMCKVMFFESNAKEFDTREKLEAFIKQNPKIKESDFVETFSLQNPNKTFQLLWGNKRLELHNSFTKSCYINQMTFDLFGGRGDCFWSEPFVNEALFDDYISGNISEEMFVKITMRNQPKC